MKLYSIRYYLFKLISDGQKWQYTNLNLVESKPKYYFSKIQFIFIFLAILSIFQLNVGFNKDFIGYILTSLSIFIGLFLSLILTIFDKFQKIDFAKPNLSEKGAKLLFHKKNFFKQFTALTSYSILISLICVFLLSLSLLIVSMNDNIFDYYFVDSLKQIKLSNILLGCKVSVIIIYRILIIYFLLDFLLMLLYALSSMYSYIALEFDKK